MAGKTIKTPVMVLTELTVKKGIPPPEFILISAINNTHDNEFTYQVVVEGVSAIGMGKSKKEAKQNTAHLALELLNRKGIYHPDFGEVSDPELREKEIPSPKKPPVNCIGSLYDVCLEYKIPEPEYLEISDVGPPHCREFTYDCRICSLRTRATAHTKKQAKQQAAQAMLDKSVFLILKSCSFHFMNDVQCSFLILTIITFRIIDVIPGIAEEFQTHLKALDNRDCEVIRNYTQLSNFNVRPNYSVKVGDFSTSLTNILKLKDIDTESLKHVRRFPHLFFYSFFIQVLLFS